MDKARILAFIDAEIQRLTQARALLSSGDGVGVRGLRIPGIRRRRRMSAEARRRISEAQKKRWAARKKADKS